MKSVDSIRGTTALRHFDRGDVNRIVEIEAREIDGDRLGNGVRRREQFDRMHHQIDRAALLDARRGLAIDHVDGHGDTDARTRTQAQEIDVDRLVGDDVELKVARQHPLLAVADFEFENRRQELAGVNELVQLPEIDRNRLGLLAAAVNDAWNAAFATNGAGGPLACPAARHDRELLDRCHVTFPRVSRPASRGVGNGAEPGL